MKRRTLQFIFAAFALISVISCAKEEDESSRVTQQKILDAYIQVNYPNANIQTTENGTKIISKTVGTGSSVEKNSAVYLYITTKDLEGNVVSTNSEELSKKLGLYSNTTYYGPKLYYLGYGSTILGLEDLLYDMRIGGKVEAIIPPWASNYEYSKKNYANTNNLIYEVELVDATTNIMDFQNNNLKAYANKYYSGLDTLEKGFYFKKLTETTSLDTIPESTSVKVRYVGKLLDGFVFDTNIRDSAKVYGIYNSSSSYDALSVEYKKEYSDIAEGSSVVKGFAKAISQMQYGESAVTFFNSDWGYGTSGSGDNIQAYTPMLFYVYIEPEK